MATIDFPEDLITLERSTWEEIQAGQLTVATATAVQTRLTQFAAETGIDRYTAEMGLKRAVRHTADDSDLRRGKAAQTRRCFRATVTT